MTGAMAESLSPPVKVHATIIEAVVTLTGVTQFLDVGIEQTGRKPTHAVANSHDQQCRTLYVDPAPLTETSLGLLGTGSSCAFVRAHPSHLPTLMDTPSPLLDWKCAVAVLLFGVLEHFEAGACANLLRDIRARLLPGSTIAATHATPVVREAGHWSAFGAPIIPARRADEVAAIFQSAGLAVCKPGVVPASHWHPKAPDVQEIPHGTTLLAACAQVPAPR
jgi:hypothetical protein